MATWLGVAQIVMALAGLCLIFMGTVSLGKWWEIRSPLPVLAGLMLLLPWPICEGLTHLASTQSVPGASSGSLLEQEEAARRLAGRLAQNQVQRDMLISGSGLLAALLLLGIGLRRRFEESVLADQAPPLAPVEASPSAIYVPLETMSSRVTIPTKVKHYQGRPNMIPPQVEALGRAKHVHAPVKSLAGLQHKPKALVYLGVTFLCIAIAVLMAFREQTLPLLCGIGAAVIGLLFLIAAQFTLPPIPTYIVYREALLIVQGNDFTIIPWKVVTDFHPDQGLTTRDDERFALNHRVRGWRQLVERVRNYVAAEQLPRTQEQVDAGLTAVFGPFEVNTAALSCEGNTVMWDEVTQVTVQPTPQSPTVEIRTQDHVWCRRPLDFPNDFIFVALLKRLCHPHAIISGA